MKTINNTHEEKILRYSFITAIVIVLFTALCLIDHFAKPAEPRDPVSIYKAVYINEQRVLIPVE